MKKMVCFAKVALLTAWLFVAGLSACSDSAEGHHPETPEQPDKPAVENEFTLGSDTVAFTTAACNYYATTDYFNFTLTDATGENELTIGLCGKLIGQPVALDRKNTLKWSVMVFTGKDTPQSNFLFFDNDQDFEGGCAHASGTLQADRISDTTFRLELDATVDGQLYKGVYAGQPLMNEQDQYGSTFQFNGSARTLEDVRYQYYPEDGYFFFDLRTSESSDYLQINVADQLMGEQIDLSEPVEHHWMLVANDGRGTNDTTDDIFIYNDNTQETGYGYDRTTGTIRVTRLSEDEFNIVLDCAVDGKGTFTGTYRGKPEADTANE